MGMLAGPTAGKIGTILCRVVVPLWILTGVVFKLLSGTPSMLPSQFVESAKDLHIGLGPLLYTLIGLELFAIGVMVFIPRFARAMAIFMLGCFCLILVNEIRRSATSCGCFGGTINVQPWQMLLIDGLLLVGVAVFAPTRGAAAPRSLGGPVAIAALSLVAGFGISFGADAMTPDTVEPQQAGTDAPPPLQAFWYIKDIDSWVGKRWDEIDLFHWIDEKPIGLESGTRYIVFYRRTCDHCEEMFLEHFLDPGIASQVTAVEVPESKDVMTSPDAWEFVETEAEHRQLALGCDWIITTPLAVSIVDGVIECAEEGDHVNCLGLE